MKCFRDYTLGSFMVYIQYFDNTTQKKKFTDMLKRYQGPITPTMCNQINSTRAQFSFVKKKEKWEKTAELIWFANILVCGVGIVGLASATPTTSAPSASSALVGSAPSASAAGHTAAETAA